MGQLYKPLSTQYLTSNGQAELDRTLSQEPIRLDQFPGVNSCSSLQALLKSLWAIQSESSHYLNSTYDQKGKMDWALDIVQTLGYKRLADLNVEDPWESMTYRGQVHAEFPYILLNENKRFLATKWAKNLEKIASTAFALDLIPLPPVHPAQDPQSAPS
jgi:hypothetical protein